MTRQEQSTIVTIVALPFSALHLAAFDNHPDVIELLVKLGAEIDSPGEEQSDMTPLRVSITRGYPECAKILLDLGADPLGVDGGGFSLLHEAANIGSRDMVEQLLSAGCDPLAKAGDGSIPVMWATQHCDDVLTSLLKANS